jgi:hypothetical protein
MNKFSVNWCDKNNVFIFKPNTPNNVIFESPALNNDKVGFIDALFQKPNNNLLSVEPHLVELAARLKRNIQAYLNKSFVVKDNFSSLLIYGNPRNGPTFEHRRWTTFSNMKTCF